jgi:RNA polymerase sigma-70 factor (ECF subfamily)
MGADLDFDTVLAAAQAGGEWALATIYGTHNPALLRFLRARAGADGDDLASQTWLDAARNLRGFQGNDDQLGAWLFTIARRRLIDHQRREGRRRETHDDPAISRRPSGDDPAATAVELLCGDEAARRIVALLPWAQAEVVLLRVVGGLTVAEVAAVTGRRPGTVRVMQHRALRYLAEALDDDV